MAFEFLVALIGPWLAGVSLLAAVRHAQGHPPHRGRALRLVGYGYFVGQALLFLLIRIAAGITGGLPAGAILWIMCALAVLGIAASSFLSRHRSQTPPQPKPAATTRAERLLTWLLLGWALLHLAFALVDVLSIPVYPWDAWLVWMYRAKAWFFSAGLPEIAAPGRWLAAESVPPYTIDAFDYPDFLSVTSAWLALILGHWSDTLINLPGLLCALAIGMALAGHLLRLGLRTATTAGIVYLLFSTPLFGAHAALGGYVDIWMAGFAGLGMIALMSGLPRRETGYIVLGLAMLSFSSLVKNEGAVWLVLGLFMAALFTVPARLQWIGAGLAAGLVALASLTGYTYVEIPGVGWAGVQDGRLHLPFIGRFVLETHQVLPEYGASLFVLGSWNLLWVILPGMSVLALSGAGTRERNVMLSFLLLFIASQVFIFGFTNQGEWARQYTAINRLPLQFLPALLYALGVMVNSLEPETRWPRMGIKAAVAPVLALLVVTALVSAWMNRDASPDTQPLSPELSFVMGAGSSGLDGMTVERYQQGFALLSSGPVKINADDFPYARIALEGARFDEPALAPALFWRRGDVSGQVSRMTLARDGLQRLDDQPEWSGQITEFGLLVPEAGPESIRLQALAVEPASLRSHWHSAWRGWVTFEPWSLKSINFLWGGAERQLLRLPPLVAAWALLAILLTWWSYRTVGGRAWLAPAGIIVLAGWMLLDARWTVNGLRQARQSVSQGLFLTPAERQARMPDAQAWELVQRFLNTRGMDDPGRILVVGNRADFGYYLERAKYHLLPHSAQVVPRLSDRFFQAQVDYVLFIDDFSADGSWQNTWNRLPMDAGWRDALELADANARAILFRVER